MERYKKYKGSGVEWIGEIPEGWEVKKLKYVADARPSNIDKKNKDGEEAVLLCNYVDVYKNEFISSELAFMTATASQEQKEKFLLQKGDVLATKDSETPDDIAIPSLVVEDFDNIVCGYHLTHIKPKKIIGSYLFRYFQTKYLSSYFEVSANGVTRYGLGVDKFGSALILNPPLEEQTAIANYLDRKTAEIDSLIAQKQRLIELYQEEKIAIINQAVTKGMGVGVPLLGTLNNNGADQGNHKGLPLRDSGIDWLGEIPDWWEVKKLKYLVSKVGSGVTPKGGASVYLLSGVPLLRSQNIHFDELKMDDVAYISEETHHSMANSKVQAGDVLLNITGASIGRCFYADEHLGEANVNQHVCIIRPKNDVATRYLYFVLRSNLGQKQIDAEQTGSGREGLNFEALNNFLIPHISLEEQTAIVHHIETETARIDAKIAKTQRIIELQKEYRTALISEVVTGKIKVTS